MGGRRRARAVAVGTLLLMISSVPAVAQQSAIDVTGYSFSIRIPDTGSVSAAVAEISYRSDTAEPLRLDLVALTVDSVRVAQRAVPFTYDGKTIQVNAPRPDGPVEVFYRGAPRDGLIIQT